MDVIDLKDRQPLSPDFLAETHYHLQTRGYSLLPNFLSETETAVLKAALLKAIDAYQPTAGVERSFQDRYQIHDLLGQDICFARLLEDPRLQQLVAPILGQSWIMYAATSSSIPPKGTNYSSRLHVDSPRFQPGYVFNLGLIWTLDEYTEQNGPLKVLPGSHHSSETPPETLFEKNCVKVLGPAGSLILFNARVFHRTGENHTYNWRHSMTMNACRSFMKQRMDWVRMLPDSVTGQLNEQARRLIGFDTRLPTSLEEFFLPEDQRLYKAGQG